MDRKDLRPTLIKLGVTLSESAIRKYIFDYGLASKPIIENTRGKGGGKGRISKYTNNTLGQLYAAGRLLNGPLRTTVSILKVVKEKAQELIDNDQIQLDFLTLTENDEKVEANELCHLIELWINYYEEAINRPIPKHRIPKYRVQMTSTSRLKKTLLEDETVDTLEIELVPYSKKLTRRSTSINNINPSRWIEKSKVFGED